ncbi:MAG: peptidase T [Corallococcus sp.]|nr:peptidase T [Corallococcus sp.]
MTLLERFLKYVQIDTQSCPDVDTVPSTQKQFNLSRALAEELTQMGATDVKCDSHGYVYATVPANVKGNYALGFIAHVDTSPAVSGANVKPQMFGNYDGKSINLGCGTVLSPDEFPELSEHVGKTLITAGGDTLLGADDKAGVAEIMTLVQTLLADPSIPHGTVKVAFTPDEEVGMGASLFDVQGFACDGAYTVDGGGLGELEYENFNAAGIRVKINGKSVHPGSAKGKMVNALLVLTELQNLLPAFENPAYTEGYEGFYHLDSASGSVESANAAYIIRDHDKTKFQSKKDFFAKCVDFLNVKYGAGTVECVIKDSYYNMKEKVERHMHLIDNAVKAMQRADVTPKIVPIRGGTDGATLSYKGLPCPNLFTGGYNFHGRYEYIPLEDMQKAVDTLLNLVDIYKDK